MLAFAQGKGQARLDSGGKGQMRSEGRLCIAPAMLVSQKAHRCGQSQRMTASNWTISVVLAIGIRYIWLAIA
jgi:hypothetical protein